MENSAGASGSYLEFDKPLWENVVKAAVASALDGFAFFTPVQPDELAAIHLEHFQFWNRPSICQASIEFDPLQHGIIVQKGRKHALLLTEGRPGMGVGAPNKFWKRRAKRPVCRRMSEVVAADCIANFYGV